MLAIPLKLAGQARLGRAAVSQRQIDQLVQPLFALLGVRHALPLARPRPCPLTDPSRIATSCTLPPGTSEIKGLEGGHRSSAAAHRPKRCAAHRPGGRPQLTSVARLTRSAPEPPAAAESPHSAIGGARGRFSVRARAPQLHQESAAPTLAPHPGQKVALGPKSPTRAERPRPGQNAARGNLEDILQGRPAAGVQAPPVARRAGLRDCTPARGGLLGSSCGCGSL